MSGTLLPAVAFAAVVAFQLARVERGAIERRAVQSARALAESFEREMSGSIQALQALAESDRLDRGELESFQGESERVLRTQPSWRHVVLLSPEGQPLVNTAYAFGGALPALAERESFARVLETRQPLVGSLAVGKGARKQLAFPVRVPVLREGVLRYVLTAVITPQSLAGIVGSPSSDSGEWTRVLVDEAGTVVARTREPERFVGKTATPPFLEKTRAVFEGLYADVSMDGERVYVAFSHSSPSGWTAAVVSPRRMLDAPVWDSMLAVGGLGLVFLLVSAGGAWVFSRRLERSISEPPPPPPRSPRATLAAWSPPACGSSRGSVRPWSAPGCCCASGRANGTPTSPAPRRHGPRPSRPRGRRTSSSPCSDTSCATPRPHREFDGTAAQARARTHTRARGHLAATPARRPARG
ncbi:cache domain-containing protein [Cystobacter fuscus]